MLQHIIEDYDRVTQVIGFASGYYKVDPEILRKAGERGTIVHEICDTLISQLGDFGCDNQHVGYINSFKQYFPEKEFIKKPKRIYCDKHLITGEIDAIYQDGNDLVLVDLKTSANENITWPLQGAAYKYLCSLKGYNIARIEFVKLHKDGKKPKIYIYDESFEMFMHHLIVYRHSFKKRKIPDISEYI